MALTGRYEHKGLVADMAYVRIEEVTGGKMFGWTGHAKVYATADIASRSVTEPPPEFSPEVASDPRYNTGYHNPGLMALNTLQVRAAYSPGQAPLDALYAALKTQPEFANFTDI